MILHASRPSMTGICMSIRMQSNFVVAEASTAFFPLSTMVTSVTPTRFRMRSKTFWLIILSSAISTLISRAGYCFVHLIFLGGAARFFRASPLFFIFVRCELVVTILRLSIVVKKLFISCIFNGLDIYPNAPAASAFSLMSSMSWAVTKTTLAASLSLATISLQASSPPMTGISMSIRMQLNDVVSVMSTAFFPLSTIAMSVTPRRFSILSRIFWFITLSSTTNTFNARGGYLEAILFLESSGGGDADSVAGTTATLEAPEGPMLHMSIFCFPSSVSSDSDLLLTKN
mmetsp:Transcript_13277/g.27842  ORF Transcript_13277/g.27842 Transcript_13277/m.27842 type:complete len:287 (-) Transcript_13277:1428-2288(-)